MENRKMNLVLAKMNLNPSLWVPIEKAIPMLIDYLQTINNKEFLIKTESWALSELSFQNKEKVLAGKLGRRISSSKTDFTETKGFVRDKVPDWIISNFIFEPKTERILFEEKNGLSRYMFTKAFSYICSTQGEIGDVFIDLIGDRDHIYKTLSRVDTLYSISFSYHLPNPRVRDHYKTMMEDLETNGAYKGSKTYENVNGINLNAPVVNAAIEMNVDGYAKYSMDVKEKNGVIRTISSSRGAVSDKVEASDDPAVFAAQFYYSLQKFKKGDRDGEF